MPREFGCLEEQTKLVHWGRRLYCIRASERGAAPAEGKPLQEQRPWQGAPSEGQYLNPAEFCPVGEVFTRQGANYVTQMFLQTCQGLGYSLGDYKSQRDALIQNLLALVGQPCQQVVDTIARQYAQAITTGCPPRSSGGGPTTSISLYLCKNDVNLTEYVNDLRARMEAEGLLLYWEKAYEELFEYIENYFYAHQDTTFGASGTWGSMSLGLCPAPAEAKVEIEAIVSKYKQLATEVDRRLSELAVECSTRVKEALEQWLAENRDDRGLQQQGFDAVHQLEREIEKISKGIDGKALGAAGRLQGKVATVEEAEAKFSESCDALERTALEQAEGALKVLSGEAAF